MASSARRQLPLCQLQPRRRGRSSSPRKGFLMVAALSFPSASGAVGPSIQGCIRQGALIWPWKPHRCPLRGRVPLCQQAFDANSGTTLPLPKKHRVEVGTLALQFENQVINYSEEAKVTENDNVKESMLKNLLRRSSTKQTEVGSKRNEELF